ncbi:PIG-L deacetylase family protein [Pirellulaceae bacterium SH467]|jgi:LmbE family N-acetylglucosaminyl deacetylase
MTKVLVLGAHPDDAEYFAGGLLARHALAGSEIRIVSVTNGQSGHQSIPSPDLITIRRQEAANSGAVIGATYITGDFPDGYLQPTLELREFIIREIRQFAPDLVLTHRPFDYHPDHRAVGQAVQDASYMVLVPKVVPDCPTPLREPLVAYMNDLFTRPAPFRADVVLDVTPQIDSILAMIACHRSQFFDWMPWIDRISDQVPESEADQLAWLRRWYLERMGARTERFWKGEGKPLIVEAFEFSEYAGRPNAALLSKLFPPDR